MKQIYFIRDSDRDNSSGGGDILIFLQNKVKKLGMKGKTKDGWEEKLSGYYFDIETHPYGRYPDPTKDEIITVQYQPFEIETGKTLGDLVILKDWDEGFSEMRIVKDTYKRFFEDSNVWGFIPVGFNLRFEWRFLTEKFKKYLKKNISSEETFGRPQIDLKNVAVLMNRGYFKGSGLDTFTDKLGPGIMTKELYEEEEYGKLEEYIKVEAEEFLKFYRKVLGVLSKLGSDIRH